MELSFATEQLRAICESRRRALTRLGANAARALETVLADIEACQSVFEFTALYGDQVKSLSLDKWHVTLEGEATMVFTSGHVSTPKKKDGHVDWKEVTRVRIELIGVTP
jgi:hypothetical protein